ncbi:MAG: hypothetical protein KDE59_01340 [Anaerolineales bacterium]|nr:hypothetical protein [Anaerolineales bacterium]
MRLRRVIVIVVALAVLALGIFLVFRSGILQPAADSFTDSFDEPGEWDSGDDANAFAGVRDGHYEILVRASSGIFRGSAPHQFADGIYEVTATQVAGPLDNGYGLIIRLNPADNSFYMFEISGDGYVWAGLCQSQCANQGWEASPAVKQGLNQPNLLRVVANGGEMTFIVNDQQVARINDATLAQGQVGFLVETFGGAGVQVNFDDFSVSPIPE